MNSISPSWTAQKCNHWLHKSAGRKISSSCSILCTEKNHTVVEYALYDARNPIGVTTYRTVKRLPKELKGMFPAPEEIAKLLEATE